MLSLRYSLASMVGMATTFFLSMFSVSCYGISPKTKFVNCLRKKTPKTHAKEHVKSLNKCFMNICWKRGLQNSEIAREKRNCSSFKKVLEREIYSFVTMLIFSAYNV